jgi:hypothetical protein
MNNKWQDWQTKYQDQNGHFLTLQYIININTNKCEKYQDSTNFN